MLYAYILRIYSPTCYVFLALRVMCPVRYVYSDYLVYYVTSYTFVYNFLFFSYSFFLLSLVQNYILQKVISLSLSLNSLVRNNSVDRALRLLRVTNRTTKSILTIRELFFLNLFYYSQYSQYTTLATYLSLIRYLMFFVYSSIVVNVFCSITSQGIDLIRLI